MSNNNSAPRIFTNNPDEWTPWNDGHVHKQYDDAFSTDGGKTYTLASERTRGEDGVRLLEGPLHTSLNALPEEPHESNLVKHAKRELALIGYNVEPYDNTDALIPDAVKDALHAEHVAAVGNGTVDAFDEMNDMITQNILDIVKLFASQGHSGFSGGYAIQTLTMLLNFENLTPLTDDPDEWTNHEERAAGRKGVWQNKRNGSAFSEDGGKTYYLLEESVDADGKRLVPEDIPMHESVSKASILDGTASNDA